MRKFSRAAALTLGAGAIAATMLGSAHATEQPSPDAPGAAAACPSAADPTIPGGKAHWDIVCVPGGVKAYGWVEDTRPDNMGACLNGYASNGGGFGRSAHGYGDRQTFDYTAPGANAIDIYLELC